MSRSFRKTPCFGFAGSTSTSEKQDKKIWHSRFRHAEKQKLAAIPLYVEGTVTVITDDYIYEVPTLSIGGENHITTLPLDVSNVWDFAKDGKHYWQSWSGIKAWCDSHYGKGAPRKFKKMQSK